MMGSKEAASGAASSGVARPSGADFSKPVRSRRETCVPRLARAIRRANRAAAKRAPAPPQAPAQDTRGKGTRFPSEEGETMTATDPRPGLPRTPIRGLAAMLAGGG